jgi:carbamoyltransferase
MRKVFGAYGARHTVAGRAAGMAVGRGATAAFARLGVHEAGWSSAPAHATAAALRAKVARGETVTLLGVNPAGQNSGAALVQVVDGRVRLLDVQEEERHSGERYTSEYPEHAVAAIAARLPDFGIAPVDLDACAWPWRYGTLAGEFARVTVEEAPGPLFAEAPDEMGPRHLAMAARAPRRIAAALGLDAPPPIVAMRHHDAHAYQSWASSPFTERRGRVLITVIDGFGDDASISVYFAERGTVRLMQKNDLMDSLGMLYGVLSSRLGGWPPLHSDGRFMGAAAWGDGDRLTNPYYRRLREILHFAPDGRVHLNRRLANWHRGSLADPFTQDLTALLGHPVPEDEMWNPDAVLRVEDIEHAPITRERVDKAAALQMVFEDAVFHVVDHGLRATGATALVMTGGTALNCVANARVVERFDEAWYRRTFDREDTRLELWAPPDCGDSGVASGAAYALAIKYAKARPGEPLEHAFWGGAAPTSQAIGAALAGASDIATRPLGNVAGGDLERVADVLARVVAAGGVVGLFQGRAEIGPRALGHRSILANPCDPASLELINARVKFREAIRPLAPMLTAAEAERLFELSPGASAGDRNAYRYMVLLAPARPEAHAKIPAVVHRDGTARLQIVREETDPLSHAYLRAMGRHVGVEASVNTSLNVGAAIAHTPEQALSTLRRARAMDGLLMVGDDGEATFAWHADRRPEGAADRLEAALQAAGAPGTASGQPA